MNIVRRAACLLAVSLSAVTAGALAVGEPAPTPLRVLMLGGGPDLSHNQTAIESNVRYVDRLLPPNAEKRVLFFDGKPQSKDVLCEDNTGRQYYRVPHLPRLDGPNTLPAIKTEFQALASGPASARC